MVWNMLEIIIKNTVFLFIPFLLIFRSNPNMLFLQSNAYSQQKLIIIQSIYISYIGMAANDIPRMFPEEGIYASFIMVVIFIIALWYFVDKQIKKILILSFWFYILQVFIDDIVRFFKSGGI